MLKRVIIESPFKSDNELLTKKYKKYLALAIADSLERGEAPFASHGFYTLYLDDSIQEERKKGICAGFAWGKVAELVAIYADYGISAGMKAGIKRAKENYILCEVRYLNI